MVCWALEKKLAVKGEALHERGKPKYRGNDGDVVDIAVSSSDGLRSTSLLTSHNISFQKVR